MFCAGLSHVLGAGTVWSGARGVDMRMGSLECTCLDLVPTDVHVRRFSADGVLHRAVVMRVWNLKGIVHAGSIVHAELERGRTWQEVSSSQVHRADSETI
jgi:hypothetical protein